MVTKWDMINYMKKNVDKLQYIYKEDEDAIYDKQGKYITSLDEYLDFYRKKSGESFESIYYEHISLINVLRCTECGTVIFTTEDEDYDPHLKCPTCTDYKTHFEYWTKEDIDFDEEKQKEIKLLETMTQERIEREKRREKRNGKFDWEIAIKKFYGKKICLEFVLECDDITKSFFKGLRLKINIGKKTKEDTGYIMKKFFTIPLSWSHFCFQLECKEYMKTQ